jgi:hypothetical protein
MKDDFPKSIMPQKAFNRLVRILELVLPVDTTKAHNCCTEEIYLEIFVAIGLHYLSGGSYDDIREVYAGVSVAGFYYCRNPFFKAILTCDAEWFQS